MSEIRRDPITGRSVIMVPGRSARPNEHAVAPPVSPSDADCPFCEGNESRTPAELAVDAPPGRIANERGWRVRVIPNRFPTVTTDPPGDGRGASRLDRHPALGFHEVVIESPTHAPPFAFLPTEQVARVLRVCRDRVRHLAGQPNVGSVTLFENAGPEAGGSLWHPHSQLVTVPELSPALEEELAGAQRFRDRFGGDCGFESATEEEVRDGTRRVFETGEFEVFAPFASAYPYELRLFPRRHAPSFGEASDRELAELAERLPGLVRAWLELVPGASYNLVVRSPVRPPSAAPPYHWHLDLYPRLVRPDGFDLGSGFAVNTVLPETAAELLRAAVGEKR